MDHNTIVQSLQTYIKETNTTGNRVARAIPISATALSQWMTGNYRGNNGKVDKLVSDFLKRQEEISRTFVYDIPFMMISPAERIFEVAKICHFKKEIGLVYGLAGCGKTKAVKEYAKRNSDVVLIEADLGYTVKVLFRELHRKLGLDGIGSIHELFEKVVERMSDTNRLIIIDEAENLPFRALDLVRRINDKARVGILLIGLPRLLHNLRGMKGEYAYLYSRVGIVRQLEALTETDTEQIVKTFFPDSNGIYKAFHKKAHANGRHLEKLIFRTKDVLEINELSSPTNDVVDEVSKLLIK